MSWTDLVRSLIVSDLGVFSSFITRSQISPVSLVVCRVTQMMYSAQGFCCEKHKIPQKCTVSEAETSQVCSCSHNGPGQQLLHKARIRPGSLRKRWVVSPGKASSPLTVPASIKERGLVLRLDFASHYPTLHSEQMWGRLFTFWNIAASRPDRKYCTTPENCPNTSKCYILIS